MNNGWDDGISAFWIILSAIDTHIYKLAKFCDKLLKLITTNKYTIKDSFSFAKEVEELDHNLIKVSFDVKSLFNNIFYTGLLAFLLRIFTETKHILTVYFL